MRIQLSLEQNSLHFYGAEVTNLRAAASDTLTFVFPVMTLDYSTSGKLMVTQNGVTQTYSLVSGQAAVPVSSLIGGNFVISAVSDLYSTNELEFYIAVTYSGNEMSPIANKEVFLNENQINIYNEDSSQYINFIMPRYYDGVDLSTKTCRIHWYSPENNVADYDPAQSLQTVGDNITFTWLIKNSLTQYVGEIQFVVEFIGAGYVWKSKICTFEVLESLSDTGGLTPAPTDQWYNAFVVEMDAKVAAAAASAEEAQALINSLAPAYSSSETYGLGEYVIYNHVLYRCTTAISTAEVWNIDHWTQVVLTEDISTRVEGRTLYI